MTRKPLKPVKRESTSSKHTPRGSTSRNASRRRPLDEDAADNKAADEALAESDERIPYDQIRRKLGLE